MGEAVKGKGKTAPFSNRDYFHFTVTGSEQRSEQANQHLFFFSNVNILCIGAGSGYVYSNIENSL